MTTKSSCYCMFCGTPCTIYICGTLISSTHLLLFTEPRSSYINITTNITNLWKNKVKKLIRSVAEFLYKKKKKKEEMNSIIYDNYYVLCLKVTEC